MESQRGLLNDLNSLRDEIDGLTKAAVSASEALDLLGAQLDRLCEYIVCEENAKRWNRCGERDGIENAAERLRESAAKALCLVEKSRSLRTYTSGLDINPYVSLLSASVKEECGYTLVNRNSKVLFVGAGAFPLSALTIALETSASIFCLDIDEEAEYHGRKLIRYFGLEGNVAYLDNGMNNDELIGQMTHVFIASLVPSKLDVLDNLAATVSSECKVIVRYGNGLKSLFNYPFDTNLLIDWRTTSYCRDKCIYDTVILEPIKIPARTVL